MKVIKKIYTFLMDTILIELIKFYRHQLQQLHLEQSANAASVMKY